MSVFKKSKSYRPFIYPFAVEAAKKHSIDMHWAEHQVELQADLTQYNTPGGLETKNVSHEDNKAILDFNLSLFTELDKAVGEGYCKLLPHIGNNEIRNMLLTFAAREVIHQRAYALAAETFGFPEDCWVLFTEYVETQDKIDLMVGAKGEIRSKLDAAKLMLRIFLGEGIALFAAFASLLNLKRHGLLINFNDVNQWSLKDEQEHVSNNIEVFKEMRKDLTEAENIELDSYVEFLVESYVHCEMKYIDLLYSKADQEDLTKDQMRGYITYLGNLMLFRLGYVSAGEVGSNPLPWMEWLLSGQTHDNFFEKRVTDYSHNKLEGVVDYSKYNKLVANVVGEMV